MAKKGLPAFKDTPEEAERMQRLVDEYFNVYCEGVVLTTDTGKPVFNKYGDVVVVGAHPPTVTGLARALGFNSRQSLLNYQGKKRFQSIIDAAKMKIEMYAEERLYDKEGSNGAKFVLQNGFGWKDAKAESETVTPGVVIELVRTQPIPDPPPEDSANAEAQQTE